MKELMQMPRGRTLEYRVKVLEHRIAALESMTRELRMRMVATADDIWVYLNTPLTHADWDGDAKAVGTYTIDTSAWGVPLGITACYVELRAGWGAAGSYEAWCVPKGATVSPIWVMAYTANQAFCARGFVPCDSNGDLDVLIEGANTTYTMLKIWGYLFSQ